MNDASDARQPGPGVSAWSRHVRYAACGLLTLAAYLAAGEWLRREGASQNLMVWLPFAIAVAVQYLLQRQWVFRDPRQVMASLPRHVAMTGVGLAINALTLHLLTPQLPLALAQLAATALIVISNAVLAYCWVFGPATDLSAPSPSSPPPRSPPPGAHAAAPPRP